MDNLNKNLLVAVNEIIESKKKISGIRTRLETCKNKDTVRVYVIKNNKIIEIIRISNGEIISRKETA